MSKNQKRNEPRKAPRTEVPLVEAIKVTDEIDRWKPQTRAQVLALVCPAEFSMFGGAAGSLKSETLLMDSLQTRQYPRSTGIIFRKTFPELQQLMDRAYSFLHSIGRWNDQKKMWRLRSGARLFFAHCQHENDVYKYWGNEYNFIGVDESTFFTEKPIRLLINSRLRSSHEDLQQALRVRLASNPGNVGHMWQQQVFMGPGGCSHCHQDEKSKLPFTLYRDAKWPSDGRAINMSTMFIPGRLSDHALLGPDYERKLAGLPGVYAKALREGCWNLFVGQYFDCWDLRRMVVPRQSIRNQWWWTYWIAIDYGFSGSAAVAYLFAKSESGIIYVIGELVARRCKAEDFGRAIKERWIDPFPGRRLKVGYLSPDAFSEDGGDGHSLAEQITRGAGMQFEEASNRRVDGWMECYTKLDNNLVKIADTCELLIKALPSRVHDEEKNPDDILKVKEDPGDDAADCFRYGVYSWAQDAERPQDEIVRAAMTNPDPTVAMIQARMAMAKLQKVVEPVDYRGTRPR